MWASSWSYLDISHNFTLRLLTLIWSKPLVLDACYFTNWMCYNFPNRKKSDYFHIIHVINNDVIILCVNAYRYIVNYFIRKISNYSLSRSKWMNISVFDWKWHWRHRSVHMSRNMCKVLHYGGTSQQIQGFWKHTKNNNWENRHVGELACCYGF